MEKNKDFILKTVNRLDVQYLFDCIKEGVVTLNELQATGKLELSKQKELNDLLQKEEAKGKEEQEAWDTACFLDTTAAYYDYLASHPKGRYASDARNRIVAHREKTAKEKEAILDDIKKNQWKYSAYRIQELLDKEKIKKEDLIQHGIITEEALELLLEPPDYASTQNGWSDLPVMKKNATDLYFFGIPSSGKSCLLSGILFYAERKGLLELEVDNIIGTQYAHHLIHAVDIGYVPLSTTQDGINYISAKIFDERQASHPVNIMEMSGELFTRTYQSASTNGKESIGSNNYLKNDNKKVIFLIIDYVKDLSRNKSASIANQGHQLTTVLKLLEKDGTLSKADALFIVLTKSDLLPNGAGDYQAAEEFINQRYLSLRNYVRRLSDQFGFKTAIHTFSLGQFMLEKTYIYNDKPSEIIFKDIADLTFYDSKPQSGKNRWKDFLG